jgi:hypothetical protein
MRVTCQHYPKRAVKTLVKGSDSQVASRYTELRLHMMTQKKRRRRKKKEERKKIVKFVVKIV